MCDCSSCSCCLIALSVGSFISFCSNNISATLAEYYIANKEPDCDWVIMPRTNISAYLGSATYMESYEGKIPDEFMEKKPEMGGVSAVKITV